MNEEDDELRRLIAALDPMSADTPVEPVTSPQARHRLEQIMQVNESGTTEPGTGEPAATETAVVPLARRRRARLVLAAAASVAVLGLGAVVAVNTGGSGSPAKAPTVMALSAPGGGPAMGMCIRLDAETLKMAPVALAGTVTALDDRSVTLHVDHWYKGGDADEVTIAVPPGGDVSPALIPGVDFEQGKPFLITATDGTVNGCGFSGPAAPELQQVYDEAFGA